MKYSQKEAVKMEGQTEKYQKIRLGIQQGYFLSPDFLLYNKNIMKQTEDMLRAAAGGVSVNT